MLTLTLWLLSMLRSLPLSLPSISVSPSSSLHLHLSISVSPSLSLHLLVWSFTTPCAPYLLNVTSSSFAHEERVPIAGSVWCWVVFHSRPLFLLVRCRFHCRGCLVCLGCLRPVLCFWCFCQVGWGCRCSLPRGDPVCIVVMLSGQVIVWCQCMV